MTSHQNDSTPARNDPDFRSRRGPRVEVDGATSLTPQSRLKVDIKVRDVSTSGFMAECAEPVLIGSYVALDIPGIGLVHAQVRWQLGTKLGGLFLDPISLRGCDWTVSKAGEAA